MMHLLLLLASASAQTDDSPDPATLLRQMAPYRAQLHATLRDGTWKTAPSEHIDGALCLEEVLVPTPGRPHDGSTLAVAEGIALADYIVDQSPYTPRYMRTHYKELGNTLVMWEGSERQYTQRTLGEFWHDAVWAGRDTLFIRDDDGRVQTLYMEATRHTDSCVCEVPGHANMCPGFGLLDSRDASMIEKDAFYTLIQLVWEGDVVASRGPRPRQHVPRLWPS